MFQKKKKRKEKKINQSQSEEYRSDEALHLTSGICVFYCQDLIVMLISSTVNWYSHIL